jgi:hypothetical protein
MSIIVEIMVCASIKSEKLYFQKINCNNAGYFVPKLSKTANTSLILDFITSNNWSVLLALFHNEMISTSAQRSMNLLPNWQVTK